MKKILIVSVGKIFGGVEKYTLDIIQHLSALEYEIHIAIRKDGALANQIFCDRKILIDMSKFRLLSSMKQIRNYVQKNKIDLIHCNSNNALFLCSLIKNNRIKKIGVIHGDVLIDQLNKGTLKANLYRALETWLINRCDGCIAVSHSLKNILISRGVNEDKLAVIYHGIEVMEYSALPEYSVTPIKICCVGNLMVSKNQIVLLKALNYLQTLHSNFDYECDLFGEGETRVELQKYINDHKLTKIRLKGFCDNIRSQLNKYTIYVQPSRYESFGIAVLEAMNAGCCVLASDVGGLREIVADTYLHHMTIRR